MQYAIIASGFIAGWMGVDWTFGAIKARAPVSFNIGGGFIGAVIAASMFVK